MGSHINRKVIEQTEVHPGLWEFILDCGHKEGLIPLTDDQKVITTSCSQCEALVDEVWAENPNATPGALARALGVKLFNVDESNCSDNNFYVDVAGMGTVAILVDKAGMTVEVYPFWLSDKPLGTVEVHRDDFIQ